MPQVTASVSGRTFATGALRRVLLLVAGTVCSWGGAPIVAADALPGARIAHDVGKGNCLACHMIPGDPAAITSANIGPPLIEMKTRFPDRQRLRDQIWDATKTNPETVMPPFGRNRILTDVEIDLLVEYLYAH